MTTQEFMAEHLDPDGGQNIINATAAYQRISGESDASLLHLALTWMHQIGAQDGWIETLRQVELGRRDGEAIAADQEEREKALMVEIAAKHQQPTKEQKALDAFVRECAEASHVDLYRIHRDEKFKTNNKDRLRIVEAEVAKRKQTDIL